MANCFYLHGSTFSVWLAYMPVRVLSCASMAVCLFAFIRVRKDLLELCVCVCSVEDVHPLLVLRFIQFILSCLHECADMCHQLRNAALAAECKD